MAKIFLRKKITERIGMGHPWIFANEIGDESGHYQPGDIVSVFSSNGSFVGKGYINPASQIRVRLLTRSAETAINELFFLQHIEAAWQFRQKL
jgi:23S rRNA (cytosine1962-C5)-methyltransferase